MKTTLEIVVLAIALIAVLLLVDAWRSARHDAVQLNATVASQNAAIQQAQDLEKQQSAQLNEQLKAIAAQKGAVQTPQQAAKAIPSALPPLPLPVSIQMPALSAPAAPHEPPPPATITVPQSDLKPLYDDLEDCRASSAQNDTLKQELSDQQAQAAALTRERDSAVAAAHGGTFWVRVKRSAKWFAIGLAAGAAGTALARR